MEKGEDYDLEGVVERRRLAMMKLWTWLREDLVEKSRLCKCLKTCSPRVSEWPCCALCCLMLWSSRLTSWQVELLPLCFATFLMRPTNHSTLSRKSVEYSDTSSWFVWSAEKHSSQALNEGHSTQSSRCTFKLRWRVLRSSCKSSKHLATPSFFLNLENNFFKNKDMWRKG